MRFYQEMLKLASYLTGMGYIVHMPFVAKNTVSEETIRMLDYIHIKKIDMSDEVYVYVGNHNYMGESVRREFEYTIGIGKKVHLVRNVDTCMTHLLTEGE